MKRLIIAVVVLGAAVVLAGLAGARTASDFAAVGVGVVFGVLVGLPMALLVTVSFRTPRTIIEVDYIEIEDGTRALTEVQCTPSRNTLIGRG